MQICYHRTWSLSSCIGYGKIPSLPVCITFYTGNQSNTAGNNPSKELNRSNTMTTMTSDMYLPIWFHSPIHNQLVDCLSRLGCQKDKIQLPKLKVHAITRQFPAIAERLNQFHAETAHGEEWALLKHIVQNGWPQDICDLPKDIQPCWTFCERWL